jgi:hypothetical protein
MANPPTGLESAGECRLEPEGEGLEAGRLECKACFANQQGKPCTPVSQLEVTLGQAPSVLLTERVGPFASGTFADLPL